MMIGGIIIVLLGVLVSAFILPITVSGLLVKGLASVGMSYLLVALIASWSSASDADAAEILRLSGVVLQIAIMSLGWSVIFSALRR